MSPFKRKVLHLGGFDPRGGRFYHQLLGEQVERSNRLGAEAEEPPLALGPRRKVGRDSAWEVTRGDGALLTQFHFLAWDDLVRQHWPKGAMPLLGRMVATYWRYLRQGRWGETSSVPRGSKIALAFPALMLARVALPGALLLWLALWLALHALGWDSALVLVLALVPPLLIAMLIAIPMVERAHGLWLLRFVIFNDLLARERTDPALEVRLDDFAATISAALDEDWDEILLVTHSNGSILAMPVMARLLELRGGELPAHFALVTLGGSIPLVGFRRDACAFHASLDRVAAARFRWVDIGSITDGASIPLVNPCLTRPIGPPDSLVQMSPRWHLYCDPATYKARRTDKYLTHFDYLRRLDRPSSLDYIGLTCAPRPLAQSVAAFEAENG